MSTGLPANPVGGIVFGVLALFFVAGSVAVEFEATLTRNAIMGVASSLLMVLGIAFIYEAAALLFRIWPSLSEATDLAYLHAPLVWLSVYALINITNGALSMHFTRAKTHWNWSTAVVGVIAFGIGAVLTVVLRWMP